MKRPDASGAPRRPATSHALVRWIALWLACCGGTPLLGQSYPTRVYNETSGLPSSSVFDIDESPDGRLWLATRNSICVYDGVEWRAFGSEQGLPRTSFFGLRIDADGEALALSARQERVYRFDGQVWSTLPRPDHTNWRAGAFTSFEIVSFDGVVMPVVGTVQGLFVGMPERWRWLPTAPVQDLAARAGELLVATDLGLFRLAGASAEPELIADGSMLPTAAVAGVAVEGSDLWLGGDRWLGRLVDGGFELLAGDLPPIVDGPERVRIEPDGRGGAFFTDGSFVLHVGPHGEHTRFGVANGFAGYGATALHRSREDILWVASDRGLSKLVSLRFTSFRQTHGLLDDEVSAVIAAAPGVLVLGHNLGFTQLVDGRPEATLTLPAQPGLPPSRQRVMDLARAPDGTIWAAVNPLGLWRLPAGDLAAAQRFRDLDGTLGRAITSLAFDTDGRLWLAGSGLAFLEGGEIHPVEPPALAGGTDVFIRRLHAGKDGRLFAASSRHGLLIYRQGEWRIATDHAVGPPPSLFTVTSTQQGEVWVGAHDGLYTLNDGRLERSSGPEVARPVYSLLEHPQGVLWIGTDLGFVRWDGQQPRRYGIRDGLAGREANRAAIAVDHSGDLWLGTDLGVSRYDARYDAPLRQPQVMLDGVEVAGRLESLGAPLELPWHENNLTFQFRALSLIDEAAVQYSGQLFGFDEAFLPPQRAVARRLHYANLPPGTYRFQLRARIGDGDWSPAAISSEIRIGRPFWTSAWFFTLLGVAVALTFTGVYYSMAMRFRARAAERELVKARQLETKTQELLRAKTQLVHSEKMAALGQLVAGVAHEVNNPINFILSGVPMMHEDFHLLAEKVPVERRDAGFDELRQGYDELAEAVTDGAERTASIVDGLRTFSRLDEAELKRVDINASLDATLRLLNHRTKDRIEVERRYGVLPPVSCYAGELNQVFMNLLVNASQAIEGEGTIIVTTAALDADRVRISIRDTGCGMDEDLRGRVFDPFFTTKPVGQGTGLGLSISHGIIERHGGTIEVHSAPDAGATFVVTLPREAPRPESPDIAPFGG